MGQTGLNVWMDQILLLYELTFQAKHLGSLSLVQILECFQNLMDLVLWGLEVTPIPIATIADTYVQWYRFGGRCEAIIKRVHSKGSKLLDLECSFSTMYFTQGFSCILGIFHQIKLCTGKSVFHFYTS